ncbi:TadE/TadG family type IV pilus assembly protein [Leucobacter sp. GX24907]
MGSAERGSAGNEGQEAASEDKDLRVRQACVAALKREERGTVTAEFAIALPAVLVVLGLVLGGIMISAQRVTLASAAADVARLEARDDQAAAEARRAQLPRGTEERTWLRGPLLCVELTASPVRGLLSSIASSATACAAHSGVDRAGQ